jgi:D-tyrosyl-tRNA(Tyr) deacylase
VRAVIQRVTQASVEVGGEPVGAIDEPGLLVYLGISHQDGSGEIAWMARKLWTLRLLRDERSASDIEAPLLVVSQFTLYGEARSGVMSMRSARIRSVQVTNGDSGSEPRGAARDFFGRDAVSLVNQ